MKKRLFAVMVLVSVVVTIAASWFATYTYHNMYIKDAKEQIRTLALLSSENKEEWRSIEKIKSSADKVLGTLNYKLRITLVDNTGKVLYDNFENFKNLGNHKDRPEISGAFKNGTGEDTRHSETTDTDTYYYAVKIDDSTVLRLSRELKNIDEMFGKIIPPLAALVVLLLLIELFVVSIIVKRMLKYISQMVSSINSFKDDQAIDEDINVYEEIEPIMSRLRGQRALIRQYIEEIKNERDKIGIITENMKEGFILLNSDKKILSINQSAKRMTGHEHFNADEHKNILELTRNFEILSNIEDAISKNKHGLCDVRKEKNYYRYYFSPVMEREGDSVTGLLILIEDITQQKNAEIIRSEFSANVSHELKTPLTTIVGFAEIIKEGMVTDSESIKKYCGTINAEGLRLISLIEDIMRLSKIEEGLEGRDYSLISLSEISREVIKLLKKKADEHDIVLVNNTDDIYMEANRNYLSELIYNLVDNAIKYNKPGGEVKLSIQKVDGNIEVSVNDTGIGIPEEHQRRVFERFYRVDKSRSKETGGTGLGLAIAKHITELYGGKINLVSRVNEGTTITVTFPEK
jgi:two-component system phosphate regulon sensor histidine kinase PhoR